MSPRVFERAVVAALGDARESRSIAYNLAALERAAGALRDRLSPEHGRLVGAMVQDFAARLGAAQGGFGSGEVEGALEHLATQLAAVTGAQSDRMTRDDGWRLLTIGRMAERLIAMSGSLAAFFEAGAVHGARGFDLLLALFDSTITYRARHPGRQETLALLDLLVIDETNPRSLGGVLRRLRTEIGKLPAAAGPVDELLALLPARGAGVTRGGRCGPPRAEAPDTEAPRAEFAVHDAAVVALALKLSEAGARLSDETGRRFFALAELRERPLGL
jgi:uncharacterized alpha-E superfamily protein